ncbi:MAG TPA: sigma factor-like helix-turn-helix DNA-binding protein [Terriglobales bacterium]|jgi:DNA-directed RNA polymerase specialized sigma24 family protein|nr:sigma factor-like helix-turn-helix DNA-binding protein [Terriglobales bacterium]
MTQVSVQPTMTSVEAELECLTYSAWLLALDEDGDMSSNPILSLDSVSRNAFLLHHVLGYKIEESALLLEMTETEFRAHLRRAYLQLASAQFAPEVHLDEPAFA